MHKDNVTTGKAAGLLGIARQSVLRAIQRGDLEAEVTEGDGRIHYSIPLDALREYQRKREQKILSAPINNSQSLAGTVSTSPADGAGQALADTTAGGQ